MRSPVLKLRIVVFRSASVRASAFWEIIALMLVRRLFGMIVGDMFTIPGDELTDELPSASRRDASAGNIA
jgi:hypothetical protein